MTWQKTTLLAALALAAALVWQATWQVHFGHQGQMVTQNFGPFIRICMIDQAPIFGFVCSPWSW